MKKRCYLLFTVTAILVSVTFPAKAQINPGKSFLFSNSLATDSVMLMASWWNSKVKTVTYEAWIKPEESDLSFDGHRTRAIIYKQHYGTSGIYLGNSADGISIVKVVVPGTNSQWSVTSLPRLKDKEWTYVALVLDGSKNKATVWVNEQKYDSVFTAPFTDVNFWAGHMPGGDGNLQQVRPVTMGIQWPYYPDRTTMMPNGRSSVDRFFRGEMDEVRIWEVARTDEQITTNRFKPLSGKEDGLLAYYNFETILANGDSLTNVKTGKPDCKIWGKNERSGLSKSLAMVRPTVVQPIKQTVDGFEVEWNLIADFEVYNLDVATDSLFNELLDDYKNLKIEEDKTSFSVKVENIGRYYVRLRGSDAIGNSFSIYSSVASVTIDNAAVASIIISSESGITSISEDMGKLELTANVTANGITNKAVQWSVDNPQLAKVDQNGLLTANANGKVLVTATSVISPSVSGSISIDITNQAPDIWTIPSVNIPAPLYWGGYQNMDQLVEPNASWDFVKKNMDGFLFHGAYWANVSGFPEVPVVATKLAVILKPLNKKNLMELGWPGTYTQFQPTADMAFKKAKGHVLSLDNMKLWGINIDEINIDLHMYLFKPLCVKHPDWSVKDINAWVSGDFNNYNGPAIIYKPGYFPDYVNTIRKSYPQMTFYAVDSPVWFWWNDFPSLGKSENNQRFDPLTGFDPITGVNNTTPVLVNGQPVKFLFNWYDIMQGVINSSGNNGFEGLGSDYPYDYTQWSEPVARESCYNKVLTYEKWFQSVGKKHTLICNTSDGDKLFPNDKDNWDKNYYEKSMATIINYQKRGGRANRYLFESWYPGPYTVVPETKKYSFTNLIKDAINYLKGIDQKIDLQIKKETDNAYSGINQYQTRPYGSQKIVSSHKAGTQTFWISIKNTGEIACYPMLKGLKMNAEGWNFSIYDQGIDITSQMMSQEGYTFSNLMYPQVMKEIKVVIYEKSAGNNGDFALSFWAFWNPQDPTNTIRDVVSIHYDQSTGIKQDESKLNLTLYPNPVSGLLTIDLHSGSRNISVKITNLFGNVHYISEFNNSSAVQINTAELNLHGLHILEVVADGVKSVDKLLIK